MGENMNKITSEEEFLEQYGDEQVSLSVISQIIPPGDENTPMWVWLEDADSICGWDASSTQIHATSKLWQGLFGTPTRFVIGQDSNNNLLSTLGFVSEYTFWKWREYMRMVGSCPPKDAYRRINLPLLSAFLEGERGHSVNIPENAYYSHIALDHYVPFELFPHVSKDNDGMIAFTPDEKYGKSDRQIKMRIGKFLTRYLGAKLSHSQIKDLSNQFTAKYGKLELKWANGEDIADVYCYKHIGFNSCMSAEGHSFDSKVHPASVYDSPDIALAGFWDDEKRTVNARCLINKLNNTYSVVYGNEQLYNMLEDLGYEEGDLTGCRIKRIENNGPGSSRVVMPYIDGDCYVEEFSDSEGEWFVVGAMGSWYADTTDGVLVVGELEECYCCGDSFDEGSLVETYEGYICDDCLDYYFTEAVVDRHGNTEYVHNDNVTYCSYESNYVHDDLIGNVYEKTFDGDIIPADEAVFSELYGLYILSEDAIEVEDENGNQDFILNSDDIPENWKAA